MHATVSSEKKPTQSLSELEKTLTDMTNDNSGTSTPPREGEEEVSIEPLTFSRTVKEVDVAQAIPPPPHHTEPLSIPSPRIGETEEAVDEGLEMESDPTPTDNPIPSPSTIPSHRNPNLSNHRKPYSTTPTNHGNPHLPTLRYKNPYLF